MKQKSRKSSHYAKYNRSYNYKQAKPNFGQKCNRV